MDIGKDLQRAYDDGYAQAIVDIKLAHKPITNADRIRSMTDEELAKWLAAHNERSAVCPNFGAHGCQASCIQCWLDWLKQEVNDDP